MSETHYEVYLQVRLIISLQKVDFFLFASYGFDSRDRYLILMSDVPFQGGYLNDVKNR